jgi:hypothetical protein
MLLAPDDPVGVPLGEDAAEAAVPLVEPARVCAV